MQNKYCQNCRANTKQVFVETIWRCEECFNTHSEFLPHPEQLLHEIKLEGSHIIQLNEEIKRLTAELERIQIAEIDKIANNLREMRLIEKNASLADCQSALISMVQQYLYRPLDPTTKEPADNLYQHDFMSAGEEAFAYLVEHGLAEWTDHDHWAIILKEREEE